MPHLEIGAAQQAGRVEYELFLEWYQQIYGQEPPINDINIFDNPQFQFWVENIRSSVWEPRMETERTRQLIETGEVTPFAGGTPPSLPEEVEPPTLEDPEVKAFGGYDYQKIVTGFDEGGNPIYVWELIGRTPDVEGAEDPRLNLQRLEAGRLQTRQDLRGQFERDRLQNLLTLERGGATNFIRIFQEENRPNPFGSQIPSPQQSVSIAQERIRDLEGDVDSLQESSRQAFRAGDIDRAKNIMAQLEGETKLLTMTRKTAEPEIQAQQARAQQAEAEGFPETGGFGRPITPPTPAGISEFVGTEAGEPIRQGRLRVPSGQAFGRLTPTETQQLGGFLEFSRQGPARNLGDLQELIRQNLPQPRRGVSFRAARR